ncbi:MAG: CaiB/BaiF CoA transferase family protein [Actinomycetota bacterium]
MSDTPLADRLVLDLSVTIPGPYATSLLQRMGARVIKVEPPQGDLTRIFPGMYAALNSGKEHIACDLKRPEGVALVRKIASRADVVVEGWRPGVADRLGIGMEQLREQNPRLVTCSISGWGATGPDRDRAGHDINYLAEAGALDMAHAGRAPHNLGVPIADLVGGTFAALRISAALAQVSTTGQGCHIDTSLAGAARDWVEALGGMQHRYPMASLDALPHYGVFETADGHHLSIGIVNEDHFWKALATILELDPADRALDFASRGGEADRLRNQLASAISGRRRDELEALLKQADTCWAFVDASTGTREISGRLPAPSGEAPGLDADSDRIRKEFG